MIPRPSGSVTVGVSSTHTSPLLMWNPELHIKQEVDPVKSAIKHPEAID